jgi:DNA-directed RNA polymerase subunit M/transcription elongation factor TFIIS
MVIKFCSKCNSILTHHKEGDKIILKCLACGSSEEMKDGENLMAGQKIKQKKEIGKGSISDEDIFATHEFVCNKCGNTKAMIIDRGIGYSDEDNLILLKCSKCGFSQRNTKKAS